MDKPVAVDGVGAEARQARQADAIGIGERSHRDALQDVVLQVFAVAERGIVVAAAITGRAAADAAGNLLPRPTERHVDAQVDPAITCVAAAVAAGAIEQRQPPVRIAAKQFGALRPAQVDPHAFNVPLAVGDPRIERVFATDPMIERQR